MHNHAPKNYICPICLGIKGIESDDTLLKNDDLVYRDDLVSVFINSFWIDTAKGHVIVVPNDHYENIYDVPSEVGHRIFDVAKKVALAIKKPTNATASLFVKTMIPPVINTRFTFTCTSSPASPAIPSMKT